MKPLEEFCCANDACPKIPSGECVLGLFCAIS